MKLEELTNAEQLFMKCIWDYGKDMPLQVLTRNLQEEYQKEYKRTTIRTFLLHLEKKKYITTYQIGKFTYINFLVDEEDYKKQQMEAAKKFWYEDSGFDMVKTLYRDKLDQEKLEQLKALIDEIED